jgi:dCMP deaminase
VSRPTWDELWLQLAALMATRSWCSNGVGAVLVDVSQRVVQSGYSGPPAGFQPQQRTPEWELNLTGCQVYCVRARLSAEERDPGYTDCPSVHAEVNALVRADSTRLTGGTAYISSVPCFNCAKALANSGIIRVCWHSSETDSYRNPERTQQLLDFCGIKWKVLAPC